MQITGNFSNFYGATMLPAINVMFMNRYKQYPPTYTKILNVDTSTRSIEQITSVTGIGLFRSVAEGAAVTTDKPQQGLTLTLSHSDFALAVAITHQMIRDDKYSLIRKQIDALVRSNRESIEIQGSSLFNNGFSTSVYSLPSGKAWFATDHPKLKAGGTKSNKLVASDLTMTSLQAAMTMFDGMVDDANILVNVSAKTLQFPKELQFKAAALLHSVDAPDTANRSINPLKFFRDGMPTGLMNRYLTATDGWFLQGAPTDVDAYWFWREKPYQTHWVDDWTRSAYHAMWYACSYGVAGPDGIVGVASS